MTAAQRIRITEVGPRDGLQNEPEVVSVADKVAFIDLLSASGVDEIEAGSFVNPQWVPQLADSEEVFRRILRPPGVVFSALVPNERGMERALALGERRPDKIAVFTAASETFSQRNTNATIAETLERFHPVVSAAKSAGLPIRAYVSCAIECPYEGPIDPQKIRDVCERLLELGLDAETDDIDLGDTIGVASPVEIERLYAALEGLLLPGQTTLHLHDTRGTALACAYAAMRLGVASFDGSCGGIGGCPFAPGASGNLATDDLVYLCRRSDYETNASLPHLLAAGRHIRGVLRRPLPGRVFSAEGGRKG